MSGKLSYIYGLFDPDEQVIRYVGQTTRPRVRLSQYNSRLHLPYDTSVRKWTRSIMRGARMVILEICSVDTAVVAEARWHKLVADNGIMTYNDPTAIRRTRADRGRKVYKDKFNYTRFAVLEQAFIFQLCTPDQSEYQKKYSGIMDFIGELSDYIAEHDEEYRRIWPDESA